MFPDGLIGRQAVRCSPIYTDDGYEDFSFNTFPIKILKVTDTHIVYTIDNSIMHANGKKLLLDCRFIDDNWISYDELISDEDNILSQLKDEPDGDEPRIV